MKVETVNGSSVHIVPISQAKFGILNRGLFVVNFVIFFHLETSETQKSNPKYYKRSSFVWIFRIAYFIQFDHILHLKISKSKNLYLKGLKSNFENKI